MFNVCRGRTVDHRGDLADGSGRWARMALMERTTFNKPRLHFDTAARPSHVTFDDGCAIRRNLPWFHYVEAAWEYATPEQMRIEIGDWIVLISGYNLGPLLIAWLN